jgi:cytochrome c553
MHYNSHSFIKGIIVKTMKSNNKKSGVKKKEITSFAFIILSLLLLSSPVCAQTKGAKWEPSKEANNLKNPLAGNTETLKYAQVIYSSYCSPCHGNKGKGDGPASAGLSTKPANHTSGVVQNQTDGALFWELTTGHNPMPSFKTTLTDNQRWELVNYIRTLKNK